MPHDILADLRKHLAGVPSGRITAVDAVLDLLAAVWADLPGSGEEAMTGKKLARAEALTWDPPNLSFVIERHGGTVMGSTRATLQKWTVDVSTGAVHCDEMNTYRQLAARDAPLKVQPLVEEIVKAISENREDARLKWSSDRRGVRVLVCDFINGAYNQTREGRRRRFRDALDSRLAQEGWQRVAIKRDFYQCDSHSANS